MHHNLVMSDQAEVHSILAAAEAKDVASIKLMSRSDAARVFASAQLLLCM